MTTVVLRSSRLRPVNETMWIPVIRRSVIEPLYTFKNGSTRLWYWRELEKTQYLSEAELREIQWQRLHKLLHFAWENNQFYRRRLCAARLTPENIQTPADFMHIPILNKVHIRNNTQAMISQPFSLATLQKAKTGGSTGKALQLFYTEECSELRNACARRHDRWAGWKPGEPIAACWGNPHLPKTLKEKLKHWLLQPMIYLDTMSVNEESVRAFVKEWHKVKPTLLFGHAHSVFLLAQYLRTLGIGSLHPKGILSTSMMLIPSERKAIEQVFGIKVTDRYGCEEVGLIGCECEKHEGMHLNIEHLYIEFIKDDGTPASAGEPGRIVVTDLMNYAMPLIRYEVGDIGVPTDRKCSCGRGLPLMEQVTGRFADFLIKKDGTRVAGVSLIENTLTHFPGIEQMQIVQHDFEEFEVLVVAGPDYSKRVEHDLVAYLKATFGKNVRVKISLSTNILPEKSGKYRFSICKINSSWNH